MSAVERTHRSVFLKSLHLRCFRNYQDQAIQFARPKTILVGNNAQGKTNLIEAVELLSTLKSRRCSRDRELVHRDSTQSGIIATIERLGIEHDLSCVLRDNGRRTFQVDGQTVRRQFDFLGQVNAVLFSSLDLQLVRGGPEHRRDWLDDVLMQLEPVYAYLLSQYKRVLKQRNAALRSRRERSTLAEKIQAYVTEDLSLDETDLPIPASETWDTTELAVWDAELVTHGSRVMRRRARLLERLGPLADRWHQAISGGHESLTLIYKPQVDLSDPQADAEAVQEQMLTQIRAKATAESAYGSSLVGPHRDEVEMTINETPARTYGSQGQQRTLVLALKLAELELIEQVVGDPPLLLLDDVLAELDPLRQDQLLDAIQDRVQTLVTTTHLGSFDARWLTSAQIFEVKQGHLTSGELQLRTSVEL